MKKLLAVLLALVMVLSLVSCGVEKTTTEETEETTEETEETTEPEETEETEEPAEETEEPETPAMTYAEYEAAEIDTEVTIEAYIQGMQAYSEEYGNTSLYLADEDGAYFVYRIACTAEEYDSFELGGKLRVTGYKSVWAGEFEITDATFTAEEGEYIAEAVDATSVLGDEATLFELQNQYVTFNDMVVEPSIDADGNEVAYLYNWDGSGTDGDDLYFNVSNNGTVYNFVVESDLCGAGTDVYEAVKNLQVGDMVNLEGFLYWYNGINPHITAVTVNGNVNDKAEGTMTYADYLAAELDSEVTIEAYIQGAQAYSEEYGNTSLYLADGEGAYFVYRIACTAEEYETMTVGSKIRVTGYKSEWAEETEIADATFEMLDGCYIVPAQDATELLGTDDLAALQNSYVTFSGMTVEASTDAEGNEVAYLYNWDGSGEEGDDLYFNVSYNGTVYSFVVESDLCNAESEVYSAVKALNVGDVVDLAGFLYWYNGANPHITSCVAAADDAVAAE